MRDNDGTSWIDRLISEMVSYQLYKKGKNPITEIDPSRRIRRGIWRDDGVDLHQAGLIDSTLPVENLGSLVSFEDIIVRKGILRRKEIHLLASSLNDIQSIRHFLSKDLTDEKGLQEEASGSDLLHPLMVTVNCSGMNEIIKSIKVERRPQGEHGDLSPEKVLKRTFRRSFSGFDGEDLLRVYDKKVEKERGLRTPSGMNIRDLKTLLEHLFSCSRSELEGILSGGSLEDFAGRGLKSITLEALFKDLSSDPSGGREKPEGFLKRLGRWSLEGPLGDRIVNDVVMELLPRLSSAPEGEAMRLEESLTALMDPRSTSILTTLVFSEKPEKRPHLIRLLGNTGDRAAEGTLKRLMEFSTMEEDKRASRDALRSMGFEI
jgi:hypothetical protein